MKDDLRWIICEHCDSCFERIALSQRQRAECARCGAVLERKQRMSIETLLALSISTGLLFIFANIFPVVSINVQGISNEATLLKSVEALVQGRITLMALITGVTIILVPMLQISLLFWLLAFANSGKAAPGFKLCMRTLEQLRPWNMLEVCLLGVLVAIVKLSGIVHVNPGIGFWALSMLAVLLILISGKDIRRLWVDLEGRFE
ncbi:paraquat-inducible protein A [Pseudomonas viridiflava]|uniref:paraquat-inducible protein A n=1 Tax=Pseudomonas viridiflava TaxID=33069 RepID=UPI000C0843C7|nr:paraquat-inducible protein A [Pseudomonas viridiflava]PHN61826.1 paraquat-inducible protein A [Pseudomonas viridiflava]